MGTNKDAVSTFNDIVKGRNAFTPRVLAYYKIDNGAVELSTVKSNQPKGLTESGFMEDVYGVTVVFNSKYDSDKSKLKDSYKEAVEYINSLKPTQKQYYERVDCYGTTRMVSESLI